ncbi:DNA-directed RNA polymerase II 13.6 kDa polypeptide, partial [Ramicandelaber brevisporus]
MNQPDRNELFVLPPGVPKVVLQPYPQLQNAAELKIHLEDHTLGNLLQAQLLKDQRVLFAAYKSPHPLNPVVNVIVQTTTETTPIAVTSAAISALMTELGQIKSRFEMDLA